MLIISFFCYLYRKPIVLQKINEIFHAAVKPGQTGNKLGLELGDKGEGGEGIGLNV